MSTETKMNPEAKALWLEALRSGDYTQGKGYLHTEQDEYAEFCCLGVLCDVAIKSGLQIDVLRVEGINPVKYGATEEMMLTPPEVANWAGISSNPDLVTDIANPEYEPGSDWEDEFFILDIAELNDTNGYTFEQIADLIEVQL